MLEFFEIFLTWEGWVYFIILSLLEIVLGIDNIIFISIITSKLEENKRRYARNLGLSIALIFRLFLLALVSFIMQLTHPLFSILNTDISGQSIILIVGGLFLIYKSVTEMHENLQSDKDKDITSSPPQISSVIMQIIAIDLIFSLDSIISAVGMTNGIEKEIHHDPLPLIIFAVIISMIVMLIFAGAISQFINDHPTIKMIALSFLVSIGILLIAEGIGQKFPKGYIYFALVYSLFVEFLNIRVRNKKNSSKIN